jgi:hypothetical protein
MEVVAGRPCSSPPTPPRPSRPPLLWLPAPLLRRRRLAGTAPATPAPGAGTVVRPAPNLLRRPPHTAVPLAQASLLPASSLVARHRPLPNAAAPPRPRREVTPPVLTGAAALPSRAPLQAEPPPAPQRAAAAASTTPDLHAPSTRPPHPCSARIHASLPCVGAAVTSVPVPLAGVQGRAPTLARLDSVPPYTFVCASFGAPSLGRVASPCSRRPRSAPPLVRPL